jgi:hypothetical protein
MNWKLSIASAIVCAIALPPDSFAKGSGRSSGARSSGGGSHAVRGHMTKKGTYVAPSRATNPNRTQYDNYSSKGNVNPASGKAGTRTPTK